MAAVTPTGEYTVYGDHLGTPHRVANGNANPVWEAQYAPFGDATVLVNSVDLPIRFPGQYHDAETGMHYNYFRDYDPSTGRYVQSDPIGLRGGLNTYAYVGGRPTRHTDPEGLRVPDDIIVRCQGLGCSGVNTFDPNGPRMIQQCFSGCEDPIRITHEYGPSYAPIKPSETKYYSAQCLASLGAVPALESLGLGVATNATEAAARQRGMVNAAAAVKLIGGPVSLLATGVQVENLFRRCECER